MEGGGPLRVEASQVEGGGPLRVEGLSGGVSDGQAAAAGRRRRKKRENAKLN